MIRAELIKLSTVRTTAAMFGAVMFIGFVVAWAVAVFVTDEVLVGSEVFTYATVFTSLMASIGGIVVATSQFQHGTMPTAVAAHPSRWPVAGATTFVATGLGITLGIAALTTGFAGAVVGGLEIGAWQAIATNTLWATAYTGLSAALGLGVGLAVRQGTAAIGGLLAYWLVLENLLLLFLPVRAARFLPYLAGGGMLDIHSAWEFDGLTRTHSALVFGGYAVLSLAIGVVVFRRRDLH